MRKLAISIFVLAITLSGCNTVKKSMNDSAYQAASTSDSGLSAQVEPMKEPAIETKVDENAPTIGSSTAPKKAIVVKTEEVTIEKDDNDERELLDFYVIMGSFSNSDNAKKLKSSLSAAGNESEILRSKAGLLRVSTLGTNDEMEARNRIEKIRIETPEHSDVWLLKTQK